MRVRKALYNSLRKAYKKLKVNALKTPVLVDVDCSRKFQTFGINVARTITRTRGMSGGPWISTRGHQVTTNEVLRLQGFKPEDVPWQDASVSKTAIGGMVGNAVTVHTVGHLLAAAMFAGGLTMTKLKFKFNGVGTGPVQQVDTSCYNG